jgi:hypothetical protein
VKAHFEKTGALPSRYRLRQWRDRGCARLIKTRISIAECAVLEFPDGHTKDVPIVNLCPEDLHYVREIHTRLLRSRRGENDTRSSGAASPNSDDDNPARSAASGSESIPPEAPWSYTTAFDQSGFHDTASYSTRSQPHDSDKATAGPTRHRANRAATTSQPHRPPSPVLHHYKFLGLDDYSPLEEVKERFNEMMRRTHPDLNPDDSMAHEKTKQLNEAYDLIKCFLTRTPRA